MVYKLQKWQELRRDLGSGSKGIRAGSGPVEAEPKGILVRQGSDPAYSEDTEGISVFVCMLSSGNVCVGCTYFPT